MSLRSALCLSLSRRDLSFFFFFFLAFIMCTGGPSDTELSLPAACVCVHQSSKLMCMFQVQLVYRSDTSV